MKLEQSRTAETSNSLLNFAVGIRASEQFGDSIARSALPLIAVSTLGAGTALVGFINSFGLALFLIIGVPIGRAIDRRPDKVRPMHLATTLRIAVLVVLLVLLSTATLSPMHIVLAALLIGFADVVFTSAEAVIIPKLSDTEKLRSAYAKLSVAGQSSSTTASFISSLVVGILGVAGLLISSIFGYIFSLFLQKPLHRVAANSNDHAKDRTSYHQGWKILRSTPALWILTCSTMLLNAGVMLGNTVLPVFLLRDLGVSPTWFIGTGAIGAIGSIVGAAVTPKAVALLGLKNIRLYCGIIGGLAVLLTAFCRQLPGSELLWVSAQSLMWNLLISIAAVAGNDVLPRTVEPQHLGLVGAAQRTLILGIMPIAALLGGILGMYLGTFWLLIIWSTLSLASIIPLLGRTELHSFD